MKSIAKALLLGSALLETKAFQLGLDQNSSEEQEESMLSEMYTKLFS